MKNQDNMKADTRESAVKKIAQMLDEYLKIPFNELIWATKRFDESPHIATGAAKARAISQFHEQLAKVSQDIYREWQLEWYDEIPSEEMHGIIHKAAQMIGFDEVTSMFKEGI